MMTRELALQKLSQLADSLVVESLPKELGDEVEEVLGFFRRYPDHAVLKPVAEAFKTRASVDRLSDVAMILSGLECTVVGDWLSAGLRSAGPVSLENFLSLLAELERYDLAQETTAVFGRPDLNDDHLQVLEAYFEVGGKQSPEDFVDLSYERLVPDGHPKAPASLAIREQEFQVKRALRDATAAMERKAYAQVIQSLAPLEAYLPPAGLRKLKLARLRTKS